MLIGIDANEANVKNRVGSNVYAFQVLKHLKKIQNSNLKFKIYLKDKPLNDLPKENNWWQYQVLRPKLLWTQWRLPLELYLHRPQPDVFFTPGHYAPKFCPMPLVITIMDLAFLRFPRQFKKKDLYQLTRWTKNSVKRAAHILTISKFTKKEIMHFYHIPEQKISVTYPGTSKLKIKNSKLKITIKNFKIKYNIKNKYFLYIGTLQPRKNLIRLLEAFKKLFTIHYSLFTNLVIVGKKGWLYKEIFQKVKQLGLEDKVIFTGFVTDLEKQVLLKNALSLLLPSLYEGFGIPVLEAMQLGCPVIVSHNSSLPEVAGKAALYIKNPKLTDSIYQSMVKMVKLSDREKQELIKRGKIQAQRFSWKKAGEKTLKVLTGLSGSYGE